MNIGFFVSFPDPNDPGTPTAGYRHAAVLIKLLSENNSVTLFTISKHQWQVDMPLCHDIVYLRSQRILVRFIKTAWAIIKHRRMIDTFIVFNPSLGMLPIVPLTRLLNIPAVIEFMDRQTAPTYNKKRALRFLGFFTEKLFLLTMRNWLTDSNYFASIIRRFSKNSNIMLYRTMVQLTTPEGKTKSLPLEIATDKVNIAYCGLLPYDYGLDILMDAFAELPPDNVHLYITGFGPMKPVLEGMKEKQNLTNVTITFLDNEVIDDFQASMDILVVPYRNTRAANMAGFPSKVLSYTWAGKAIIATRTDQLLDFFEDGKTAVMIEPGSRQALKESLEELINNQAKIRELGINAKKYFDENFSEHIVKSRLNDYLTSIVNRGK